MNCTNWTIPVRDSSVSFCFVLLSVCPFVGLSVRPPACLSVFRRFHETSNSCWLWCLVVSSRVLVDGRWPSEQNDSCHQPPEREREEKNPTNVRTASHRIAPYHTIPSHRISHDEGDENDNVSRRVCHAHRDDGFSSRCCFLSQPHRRLSHSLGSCNLHSDSDIINNNDNKDFEDVCCQA